MQTITAKQMAEAAGVKYDSFLRALARAGLRWHTLDDRWRVTLGSPEHEDMKRVMRRHKRGLARLEGRSASPW